MKKIMPPYWLCLAGMEKCEISAINAKVHRRPSPLGTDLYGWCAKNTYLAPLMSLGMLSRRGMRGNQLSATFVARLTSPRTAHLEANSVNVCRRAMWPVTVRTLPMSGALPQPMLLRMLLLMCHVWMLLLLRRFRPPLQLPSSSAPISSWASQVNLQNSECVSASEDFRDSSIVSTPQLFSSSGDFAGCETIAPSGSDDLVDHESCGPTCSEVNDVNHKSSTSNSTSATRVLDHGAGDAATQPSCDSINSNDTTCSDVVSVIGVEKDPADISNINKNIDNRVNCINDNNVSVIVVDSGFVLVVLVILFIVLRLL